MRADRVLAALSRVIIVLSAIFMAIGITTGNLYFFAPALFVLLGNIIAMLGAILSALLDLNERQGK